MRFSGWKGLKAKAMMVSVNVNRLTLVPVSAFHIVMELGLSITAIRSRQESWSDNRKQNTSLTSSKYRYELLLEGATEVRFERN